MTRKSNNDEKETQPLTTWVFRAGRISNTSSSPGLDGMQPL